MWGWICFNVCKKGVDYVILLGGKIELGEILLEVVICEVWEEICLVFDLDDFKYFGIFDVFVVNYDVDGIWCVVYVCNWCEIWFEFVLDFEIVEYEWIDFDYCYDDVC